MSALHLAWEIQSKSKEDLVREISEIVDSLSALELRAALTDLGFRRSSDDAWNRWFAFCKETPAAPNVDTKALLDEMYDRTR